jgi:hypothetical protein
MTESPNQEKPLPTIWRTPDELWEIIEPILEEHDPPKSTGRPRVNQRHTQHSARQLLRQLQRNFNGGTARLWGGGIAPKQGFRSEAR